MSGRKCAYFIFCLFNQILSCKDLLQLQKFLTWQVNESLKYNTLFFLGLDHLGLVQKQLTEFFFCVIVKPVVSCFSQISSFAAWMANNVIFECFLWNFAKLCRNSLRDIYSPTNCAGFQESSRLEFRLSDTNVCSREIRKIFISLIIVKTLITD